MKQGRYVFIMLFVALCALAGEPKFHYQDCVTVTSGFYRGCYGRVRAVDRLISTQNVTAYDVSLTCKYNTNTYQILEEYELEAAPKACDAN